MLIKTAFAQILLNSLTNYCSHQWGKSSRLWSHHENFSSGMKEPKQQFWFVFSKCVLAQDTTCRALTASRWHHSSWGVVRQTDGQTNRIYRSLPHPVHHCLQWGVSTHFAGVSAPCARNMKQVQFIWGLAVVDTDTDFVELHWWQSLYREIPCLTWGWLKPRVYKPICKQCVV